jgi:hypothetical protein
LGALRIWNARVSAKKVARVLGSAARTGIQYEHVPGVSVSLACLWHCPKRQGAAQVRAREQRLPCPRLPRLAFSLRFFNPAKYEAAHLHSTSKRSAPSSNLGSADQAPQTSHHTDRSDAQDQTAQAPTPPTNSYEAADRHRALRGPARSPSPTSDQGTNPTRLPDRVDQTKPQHAHNMRQVLPIPHKPHPPTHMKPPVALGLPAKQLGRPAPPATQAPPAHMLASCADQKRAHAIRRR